jgi:hypothetical protein
MTKFKLEKKELAFKSHDGKRVFGNKFQSGFKAATEVTAKLLLTDQLNPDGTINTNNIGYLSDSDIWSYIYYLYHYNKAEIIEFRQMSGEDGLASAERFYDVVKSVVKGQGFKYFDDKTIPIPVLDLIKFVSKIVEKYGGRLVNPVIRHFNNMVTAYMNDMDVIIRTGKEEVMVERNASKLIDSDIVIKILQK